MVIEIDEFSFIDSIQQSHYRQSSLIKGIGDDAAVFRPDYQDVVTAKDMFVEKVHFARHTMMPFQIGYKALAANLCDMAAMGAKPAFYLVGISISEEWSLDEISEIFNGMKSIADTHKVDLIGGDTVSGNELVISITVIGFTDKSSARYRSEAREGDIVFATGTIGDSQAGFHILNNPGTYEGEEYFIKRHQMPSPRIEFAQDLQKLTRLALNDISDGIASEAHEIADASQVTIVINEERIPIHSLFNQFSTDLQYRWKLFGGEDYELLGTVPIKDWNMVMEAASQQNICVTEIGYVTSKRLDGQVFLQRKNGHIERLEKRGYNHLSR